MVRVLSIGECMIELSPVASGTYRRGFAGDTFNTAWYLRRLMPPEQSVAYFTNVGDDALSREMLGFMQGAGIDIAEIRALANRVAGLYLITLDGHERSFAYWRDTSAARALADDEERLRRAVRAADIVYTSGITLAILPPDRRAAFLRILGEAKADGRTIAFDPNIRERLWPDRRTIRESVEAGATVATICLPSFDDETRIFGDANALATAERYRALGPSEIVVKDGAGSALLMLAGEPAQEIAAHPVDNPVDTTGAGDSFGAAYLASRIAGRTPDEAVAAAHRVAAQVIQGYGALVEIDRPAEN